MTICRFCGVVPLSSGRATQQLATRRTAPDASAALIGSCSFPSMRLGCDVVGHSIGNHYEFRAKIYVEKNKITTFNQRPVSAVNFSRTGALLKVAFK